MAFVDAGSETLTGVWQGVYTQGAAQTPFTATLMELAASLSGTTHETHDGVERFAMLAGSRSGRRVRFAKTYNGSGGWSHTVAYEGVLSSDGTEIEGRWSVQGFSGTFLMMRSGGKAAIAEKRAYEVV